MIWRERTAIRLLHLLLSIPIVGFIYGPVSQIAPAAFVTRWVAFPLVVLSGLWLWLKPRIAKQFYRRRVVHPVKPSGAPFKLEV
ncbi:MAG TPA: hypothetical protein VGR47_12155 [Terracidiphilus sp.]|nr:hypothetical protein [Terracidiphilus sp.]